MKRKVFSSRKQGQADVERYSAFLGPRDVAETQNFALRQPAPGKTLSLQVTSKNDEQSQDVVQNQQKWPVGASGTSRRMRYASKSDDQSQNVLWYQQNWPFGGMKK